ncbi:hypothetical protein V2J52_10410 [Georgenia sp. MJ173]|uniref:hypothetical protein n=1 Tax=Georgenia sunbinii TaxID=3117728 RepID=UPI002F2621D2
MTRRLPVVLAILGAVVIIASVIAAALVRSTDTVTLALPERPDEAVVVTEPGVLSAVDPTVTIRAVSETDEPVTLAVGRTSEVEAWLDGAEHVRVVGLSSWEELSVEVSTAAPAEPEDGAEDATEEPTAAGLPNPAGSDLWVAEAVGTGEIELSWADRPGRWSLVAAGDGSGPAPMVELEWGREVGTPWLVPGIVVGALLLLVGGTMLVLDGLARREQRRRDEARERQDLEWTPAGTGPIATIPLSSAETEAGSGERLSRRQIREMERSVAQAERRRRRGDDAPPIPMAGDDDAADHASEEAVPAQPSDDDAADHASDVAVPAELSDDDAAGHASDEAVPAQLSDEDVADVAADEDDVVAQQVDTHASDEAAVDPLTEPSVPGDAADGDGVAAEPVAVQPLPSASRDDGTADQDPPDEPEIPADGSTPRPAAAAVPARDKRGWWARRRAAAARRDDAPAAGVGASAPAEPTPAPLAQPAPEPAPLVPLAPEPSATTEDEPARDPEPTVPPAERAPAQPHEAADQPDESDETDETDETVETDETDSGTELPSWRSVWGFGGAPAPREDRPIDRHDDQGEEAR